MCFLSARRDAEKTTTLTLVADSPAIADNNRPGSLGSTMLRTDGISTEKRRFDIVLCLKGEAMKRIILALAILLATSSVASAQFIASTENLRRQENLRGLTGVRLVIMFHGRTREEAFDEIKRPGVLKMLEDDTAAKLEKAGIPFARGLFADKITKDYARLIVRVRFNVPNGFVSPLEPEVQLLQTVRLARDPSIEFDAVSWSLGGFGNKDETPMMRRLIAGIIDRFIDDYLSVNPKQSASSGKDKSKDTKR